MSEVEIYLCRLCESFCGGVEKDAIPSPQEATRMVSQLHSLFKAEGAEALTQTEIDAGIITLMKSSPGKTSILDLMKSSFMKSNYKEALGNIFELLSDLLNNYDKKMDVYMEDIIPICLQVLRSSCPADIKLKSILPLSCVVSNVEWSQHVQPIADLTVNQIVINRNTPSILNKQLFLLGMLCEKHPERMIQHSERMKNSLMNLVCEDVSSAKINFTAKEGMFTAVQGYMTMNDLDPPNVEKVYRCVKTFSDPRDFVRKGFARGAIKLLGSKDGKVFSEFIFRDYDYWLPLLIKYITSNNAEDRHVGCVTLSHVYSCIGDTIVNRGSCDYSLLRLQYLMKYFKRVISSRSDTNELEYKLALEGFAAVTSKCKDLLGDEEFNKVTEILTQMAKLILKDEDVSATEFEGEEEDSVQKIDKICMYINALATLGCTAKECLADLLKILISEYPQCPANKRNHAKFTLSRQIGAVDLQILIPYAIRESCRHSISMSLQYNKQWKSNTNEHTWTYEHFVDVWECLFNSLKGEDIFKIYMESFLKLVFNLDSSVNIKSNGTAEFEEIETPNYVSEYSYFVNLCDLTSTIFDFFTKDLLSIDWCLPWLHRIFEVITEKLLRNPLATSVLKVAQAALVVAKKLDVFSNNLHSNIAEEILQLYEILGINKSSGPHQLRTSLFVLQVPHQILNKYVLELASEAFQVVLRNGKNNLDLISEAMDILHEWDSSVDRDSFRPLCVKILPALNDYLCSSGISDNKILDGDRSTISRYEFATRRRRVLLTQGTRQQLEAVQQKIMTFIGKMDSDTLQCLLIKSEDLETGYNILCDGEDLEDVQLNELSEKLKITLPCPEQRKIDIYLDSLVPRIKSLALNSTNRDTRVTACQVLHSMILLIYGTHRSLPQSSKTSLTNSLSELTSVMLLLAADTDATIADMFDPLLTESCHWFTSPVNASSLETEKFLRALMRGACHPSDSIVREKACLALKEIVKWSIKQSSDRDLGRGPPGVAAILRSVGQDIMHPDAYKKRGAFLIFNNIASQVYQIESMIDKFLPEILYQCVTCINFGHTGMDKQYSIYRESALKAVNIILKGLQNKASLFKKPNPVRRTPHGFGESLLKDIILWILKESKNCNCRITAKNLFKTYTVISKQLNEKTKSNNHFIYQLIMDRGFKYFAEIFFEPDTTIDSNVFSLITDLSYQNTVELLLNHISCIDCHILVIEYGLMEVNIIYTQSNVKILQLFKSLDFLLSLNHNHILQAFDKSKLTVYQMETLKNLLFKTYWNIYKLFLSIQKSSTITVNIFDLYINKMCSTLPFWLFDHKLWLILHRNVSVEDLMSVECMIIEMKQNFSSDKWNLFVECCENYNKEKLVNIFQKIDDASCDNFDTKYLDNLVQISKLINSQRLFMKQLKHFDVVSIFEKVFLTSDNRPTARNTHLIDFLLNSNLLRSSDVVAVLLKPSVDKNLRDSFLRDYQDPLCVYFLSNHVDLLSQLETNHDFDMDIVLMMLKYITERKYKEAVVLRYITNMIIKVWPNLVENKRFNNSLVEYFTLLAIAQPPNADGLYSAHSMRSWLLEQLKNPRRKTEKKIKLIYLLAALYKPSDDTIVDVDLSQALEAITDKFPQRSDEFPPGSPEREKYLSTFRAILETMANSGNFAIFKAVVNTSCVDEEHLCEKQINHKIISLMERLSPHQSFVILDWTYAAFLSKSRDPSIRLNLLNRFLVPMVKAASVDSLDLFFGEHILTVVEKLEKDINTVKSGEIPLKHLFAEWTSSFILSEVMFSKIPDDLLKSKESKIGAHDKKWKSLFSKKCLNIRNVTVPSCDNQTSVLEYLRVARCSSYKCLYTIVITSSNEGDINTIIKKYELLLNNSNNSLLWEGMIDLNKQYVFPLEQTYKLKYHTVRSKNPSGAGSVTYLLNQNSLSQSLMVGVLQTDEERRKMIFSQTLQDDILKYDLNMATVRDLNAVKIPWPQDQDIIEMEDTDLLNHEIITTVCCVLRDIDRITCPLGEEEHQVLRPPNWLNNFVTILSDPGRQNNVKLFLSQVMVKLRQNDTDIFMKYSRLCLKPLLGIVHDRCTTVSSNNNTTLNFWDIGILSMVLSWRDTAVPSTPEEVAYASYILEMLVKQINPNTQSSELFKHSLELLKDIMNIWGKQLKLPSNDILNKLQTNADESLAAGIQIAAVVLASGCRPWQDDAQFNTISKILIKHMNHPKSSKIYKSSSEVLGLMLQLLYQNCTVDQSGDVDMENKDHFKYKSLADSIRDKLKELKQNKAKFIMCLYLLRRYHNEICNESLISFIIYLIPKLPVHTKYMCFGIFLSGVDSLDPISLQHHLVDMDVKSYLKDKDLGMICLHVLNKLFDKVKLDSLLIYMEDVCSVSSHKNAETRRVAYEVLMKAYNALTEKINRNVNQSNISDVDDKSSIDFSMTTSSDESRKRPFDSTLLDQTTSSSARQREADKDNVNEIHSSVKAALLLGMEDEEEDLRNGVGDFWADKLNSNLQDRWLYTISQLNVDKETVNQGCEMERAVRLVLGACKRAPDYETAKLFNEPLDNCAFMDYNLNGNRPKQSSLLAPMFAETINMHRQLSSLSQCIQSGNVKKAEVIASQIQSQTSSFNATLLNQQQQLLRSTLDSVVTGLSLDSLGRSLFNVDRSKRSVSNEGFSLEADSSLLFSMDPPLIDRKTYKPLLPHNQKDKIKTRLTSEEVLRRTLIVNKNMQKAKFAAIAMERNIRKEQKRVTEKPAPIFRHFRKGDYPDIQISLDNVMAPLLGLAARDHIFSKDLYIVIFKSLLAHCSEAAVNAFKQSTAQHILSCVKTRTIPLSVEALLEVCRICLKSGSEDVNNLIRAVAKNNNVNWLGNLLLEELSMDEDITTGKRIKREDCGDGFASLPPEIRSRIRSLKWNSQWEELQALYGDTTGDANLNNAERLHCTEEYFNCFAHLSDWTGLMDHLEGHLTPDSLLEDDSCVDGVFNLNMLWSNDHRKDAYMHLVFMVYIQMRANVDSVFKFRKLDREEKERCKKDITNFFKVFNVWSGESDKSSILKGRLSPYVSLWKTVNGDYSVEECDEALKWLRQEWTRECSGVTHSGLQNTLDVLQTVSETRNYLDLILTISSNRNNDSETTSQRMENTQYSWRQCVPRSRSDTIAWDTRLACRSIYTCQLQNIIRSKFYYMEDSEKQQHRDMFSRIQRQAELCLTKAAIQQKNYHFAKKLIDKHINHTMDGDELLPWQLEETRCLQLAADRETDVGPKITRILDCWSKGNNVRGSQKDVVDHKCLIGLLEATSDMSDMLCSTITKYPWTECFSHLTVHKSKLETLLSHSIEGFQKEYLLHSLMEYSSSRLEQCIDIVEQNTYHETDEVQRLTINAMKERQILEHKAEVYLKMVHYSRKAKQDYLGDSHNDGLLKLAIVGILKGMKYGNVEARKLFPVLLLDLEELSDGHPLVKLFIDEISKVPSWMFLPWSAQLLAHLPTQRSTLLPLLTRLAQEYPAALRHHYQLSKNTWVGMPDINQIIDRFDQLLFDANTATFTKAFGSLKCPWTALRSYLERLYPENCDRGKVLDELKADLLTEDITSPGAQIRGQLYDDLVDSINKLECLRNEEFGLELHKVLHGVLKDCDEGQKRTPERSNIARFSPYLAEYKKNVSDEGMEVFGQYDGFQSSPPDPKKHITIVKFHPEVSIFKRSNRRPLQMSLYGSNGKKYSFLIKCNEDLRQDSRIEQVLDLMNHPLNQISMHLTTYKVFPLSQSLGVIEYVKGCATLNNIITHSGNDAQDMMLSACLAIKEHVNNLDGNNLVEKYGTLATPENMLLNLVQYRNKVKTIPQHFLRNSMQKIALTSEMFVKMKTNFVKTMAPMNIAHWILGIGDRHLSNCMMSLTTGDIVGIDFGHAFGTATQQLDIPELMPFRLTPQIRGVLGESDNLSELMWQALSKLCEHRSLLLAAMEVFVREPTLNWIKSNTQQRWQPRHKIDQCKRKLNGIDPLTIIIEDLQSRTIGEKYIPYFCQIVRSNAAERDHLSVDEQIDRLIKLATDDGIMSVTYYGWNPYF